MALWTQAPNRLQAGGILLPSAENASLTEYDGDQIIAKVRVGRVFMDHEKLGFFRLGLAPLGVVQNVQLQILSANFLTNAIANASSLHAAASGVRHLEFRDMEICFLSEPEPRLRAAKARINSSGALELSAVSAVGIGGEPVSIPRATLQMSGAAAGMLRWRDGETEHELFVLKPKSTEKQKT